MNTIVPYTAASTFTLPAIPSKTQNEQPTAAADQVTLTAQPVTIATPQSLLAKAAAPAAPSVQEDHAWTGLGKAAAITAGVVGGAVLATAVCQLAGIGGLNVGGVILNSLYQEALPKAIGMNVLLGATSKMLLAAPVLGGIAGGMIGGIASSKKEDHGRSEVPGSGHDLSKQVDKQSITGLPRWTWNAAKTQLREAGEAVHDGINSVGDAQTFGEAVSGGAKAGWAFGSRIGNVSGRAMGIVQGAYLGGLMAGMPFAFAPLTAVPLAIVGIWGIGEVMSVAGGVVGGTVTGAGGAVAGAIGYGVKKVTEAFHKDEPAAPAPTAPQPPATPPDPQTQP